MSVYHRHIITLSMSYYKSVCIINKCLIEKRTYLMTQQTLVMRHDQCEGEEKKLDGCLVGHLDETCM